MFKFIFSAVFCLASVASLPAQPKQMGNVSTGEAKVYTSRRTVGITDAKAAKVFENVTATTALKTSASRGEVRDMWRLSRVGVWS